MPWSCKPGLLTPSYGQRPTEGLRKDDSHIVPRVGVMLGLEARRERISKDTSKHELDKHVEGRDKEQVGEGKAVRGEHPFVVDGEKSGK